MRRNRNNLVHTFRSQNFLGKIVIVPQDASHHWSPYAPQYLKHFLNTVCKVGEEVTMVLTNKKPKRTIAQNSYYWLYLGIIEKETGNLADDMHKLFKGKFLSSAIVEVFGEKVRREKSTTDLTVTEFSEYIEKISAFTGIEPPPTENFDSAYVRPLTPIKK